MLVLRGFSKVGGMGDFRAQVLFTRLRAVNGPPSIAHIVFWSSLLNYLLALLFVLSLNIRPKK